MKNKKISIKWLVFGGLLMFVAVILCLLWLFQTVFLESFYEKIKTDEIKNVAVEVCSDIDKDDIYRRITDVAGKYGVCVIVMDENGNIFSSAEGSFLCAIHKMTQSERVHFATLAKDNGGVYSTVFDLDHFEYENGFSSFSNSENKGLTKGILYVQIVNSANNRYAIMLNSQITPVDATVSTLRVQLLIITGIVIVLAIVLSFVIMRVVSSPISRLNTAAKKLACADYAVSFDESGYKEISELASTLNYASSELSKTDALQKELIANVSHDLRTPLTMIGGYAEMMRDIPGENTAENAQIIVDETKRLSVLVNDTLDLSKLGSETASLNLINYNFTESVRNLLTRYAELKEKDGYDIDFEYDGDVFVTADSVKITQVIYNLINNAVNYSGDDKKIVVCQTINEDFVRLDVIDHGIGIAPEELPTVWDRYYRSKDTHKRSIVGSGLGLSIVRKVLDMHNACYGVSSDVGQGSDFWFELPTNRE